MDLGMCRSRLLTSNDGIYRDDEGNDALICKYQDIDKKKVFQKSKLSNREFE